MVTRKTWRNQTVVVVVDDDEERKHLPEAEVRDLEHDGRKHLSMRI
jgi:hypothetical protein